MRALRAAVVVAAVAADRATKHWALHSLQSRGRIALIPFVDFVYVENTGAAFGMGRGSNRLFIGIAVCLVAYLIWQMRQWPRENRWLAAGGVLVLSGALGNMIDRFAYGFVVDFIAVRYFPWVFNVADSCVTVGACCLALGMRAEHRSSPSVLD